MGVGTAAIYFTLVNEGNTSDALVDASSDAAESARFHETQMEGNIISMVPVTRIEIPAKGLTELKPGGLHVMLMGLKQDLNNGDTVSVTLRFEKSDEVVVEAEVRAP
jgi:copper(I)-binding protein|tara:strand:- start:242 stop:562 length:321 start_codon:yes stop_codon:yes gene_type:complete